MRKATSLTTAAMTAMLEGDGGAHPLEAKIR